mgnify:FL=1
MPINNSNEIIAFHTIKDFEGESFFIPDYQRGYRWTEREVLDLLNDWNDFYENNRDGSYFMQPIVVKKRPDDDSWEVVDGQQRLTTVHLILQALNKKSAYDIKYAVLDNSSNNVADIGECQNTGDDINLYYMKQAYKIACGWMKGEEAKAFGADEGQKKKNLSNFIFNKIRFLWYRADLVDDSPGEKIFQRLNIGKIELTQSELIKALFLSNDNFTGDAVNRKEEFARQWDEFEAMFQNDEFWYFLTDGEGADSPTRIDFLLGMMTEIHSDMFEQKEISRENLDSRDGLFRAYYSVFRKNREQFKRIWDCAVDFMDIMRLWYEDVDMYHLVGFRVIDRESIPNLIKAWNGKVVSDFMTNDLVGPIVQRYIDDFDAQKTYGSSDTNGGWKDRKSEARGVLLLSNVLQVLRQNKSHEENQDYTQGIFYKFPFHLYKKQKKGSGYGWDVEHIASATDNDLDSVQDQREWILFAYLSLTDENRKEFNKAHRKSLCTFFSNETKSAGSGEEGVFSKLYESLTKYLGVNPPQPMSREEKNRISNFVLLDSATNRGYKNAIFPTKRLHVKDKERGRLRFAEWNKVKQEIEIREKDVKSAFVPPCTKDVFMKAYSNVVNNSMAWTAPDAAAYADYLTDLSDWFKEKYCPNN